MGAVSARSRFCKALEAGTEFADTRDQVLHAVAVQHLASASNYYLKADLQTSSEYAKATKLLFDAYVYMDNAEKEKDPDKKAKLYLMIERVLQTSAGSYTKAEHPEKREQMLKLLEKAKEEQELAVSSARAKSWPNVFKLKGVENLTDIFIALTSALRMLPEKREGPRRACLEIISDVLLQHNAIQTRKWLEGLIPELRSAGFTTLAVMDPLMHSPQETHAILDLFEGEVNVCDEEEDKKVLAIKKMYNQMYLSTNLILRKEKLKPALATRKGKWMEF